MRRKTTDVIESLLTSRFHVPVDAIQPQSSLNSLGLDSLTLMELVFAIEDEFEIRIPEDRLDTSQSGLTLAELCLVVDGALAVRAREAEPED